MTLPAPTPDDVLAAAKRLAGQVQRTPVLRSATLDRRLGAQLFFKCENLQRTGSVKFRGAYNAIAQFDAGQRERGALTFSAGNHAQAIALAARLHDSPALVVMPEDAAAAKMAAARDYGAQVVTYDPLREDREALSERIARERAMALIPPSEHAHVIAGQGTAALELLEDVANLDLLIAAVGGGGLLSGSLLAVQARQARCEVWGVEPESANDAQQSLRAGHVVRVEHARSIADGALAPALSPLTFSIIGAHAAGVACVGDLEILQALRFYAERMKLVVEPTGALALAGAQSDAIDIRGKRVGVIVSGGNVDLARYARFVCD